MGFEELGDSLRRLGLLVAPYLYHIHLYMCVLHVQDMRRENESDRETEEIERSEMEMMQIGMSRQ